MTKLYEMFRELSTDAIHPWTQESHTTARRILSQEAPYVWPSLPRGVAEFFLTRGFGIEIEVESAVLLMPLLQNRTWLVDRDPSLRGEDAYEYKTTFGQNGAEIVNAITAFCDRVAVHRKDHPDRFQFSERTSVHIHVDVRQYSLQELAALVSLYILFERGLFRIAGQSRSNNIFCVPVRNMTTLGAYKSMLDYLSHWEKYSALNLRTTRQFGTVEYRHMEGNADLPKILQWLLCIACLQYAALWFPPKVLTDTLITLKGKSEYNILATKVFGPVLGSMLLSDASDMDAAVTDAKFFLLDK